MAATNILSRNKPPARGAYLAAFGKHPGWDDHIEDQGLETPRLVETRRLLYTEGVGKVIDAGSWDKLTDEQRSPNFAHVFAWSREEGLFLGRLWSSVDGKGRSKYPMIVVAQLSGVSASWALREVLPRLEQIEIRCKAAKTASEVKSILDAERERIRIQVNDAPVAGDTIIETTDAVRALASRSEWGEGAGGLRRVLYAIDREMASYRSLEVGTRSKMLDDQPQHFRAPACAEGHANSLLAWLGVMVRELTPEAPVMVLRSIDNPIVDVIVGEPNSAQLFCLKASEKGLPPASEVPYSIDDSFLVTADAKIVVWREGKTFGPGASASKTPARGESNRSESASARANGSAGGGLGSASGGEKKPLNMKLVGIGAGAMLLVAVLLLIVMNMGSKLKPQPGEEKGSGGSGANGAKEIVGGSTPSTKTDTNNGTNAGTATKAADADGASKDEAAFTEADPREQWKGRERVAALAARLDVLEKETLAVGAADLKRASTAAMSAAVESVVSLRWTRETADRVRAAVSAADTAIGAEEKKIASMETALVAAKTKASQDAEAKRKADLDAEKEAQRIAQEKKDREAAETKAADAKKAEDIKKAEDAKKIEDARIAAEAKKAEEERLAAAAKKAADDKAANEAKSAGIRGLLSRAETLMEQGFGPADAAPGGSLSDVFAEIAKQDPPQDVVTSVAAARARFDTLLVLSRSRDANALRARARESAASSLVSETLVAWRGVTAAAPASTASALAEWWSFTQSSAAAVLTGVKDEARRGELNAEINAAASTAWVRTVNAAGPAQAGDFASLASLAGEMKLTDAARGGLKPHATFNLALAEFQASVAAVGASDDAKLRQTARAFADRVGAMDATVAKNERVTAMLQSMAAAITPPDPNAAPAAPPPPDLATIGPGAAGWTLDASKAPEVLTYTKADAAAALVFRRVAVPSGGGTTEAYLGTNEVTFGQFVEIFRAAGKSQELRTALRSWDARAIDPRNGVRVWDRSARGDVVLASARGSAESSAGWIRSTGVPADVKYYPPGLNVEPPRAEHPMQQVSIQAALAAARLVGCRLPTSAEWAAAAEGVTNAGANLRDAAWKKVFDNLTTTAAQRKLDWPALGRFAPAGAPAPRPPTDGEVWPGIDDGVVWFAPAQGDGSGFSNLIGNVSEFVLETPPAGELNAEAVRTNVRVVGGSALSDPGQDPRQPQPVDPGAAGQGFADVGFRLAFSVAGGRPAGPPPLNQEILRIAGPGAFLGE